MVSYGSLLVMITTVFDKTLVWPRKSILSVKNYPDVVVNHLKLIRDKFKFFLEMKIWLFNRVHFKMGMILRVDW